MSSVRRHLDRSRNPKAVALGLLLMLVGGSLGCVERRYTIRTNPPGAVVYVNGEEFGPSPVSVSYTYYQPHEIILVADGYQTRRLIQEVPAPWYDNNLTDFFTENLIPFTIRDERDFYYELAPAQNPTPGQLLQDAEAVRAMAKQPPPERRRGFFGFLGF